MARGDPGRQRGFPPSDGTGFDNREAAAIVGLDLAKASPHGFATNWLMNSPISSQTDLQAEVERLRKANLALVAENQTLREARDASLYSEQHFRLVAENTVDLICEVSQHGAYTYISPNHHEILGYRPKELLGQNFAALIHREDVDDIVDKFSECMVSGLPFVGSFRLRNRAGGWRWMELAAKPLEIVVDDPDQPASPYQGQAIFVYRDITERRETRQALATETERLTITLRSIADGVIATDLTGAVTQVNDAALQLTALPRNALIGNSLEKFFEFLEEENRSSVRSPVIRALTEGVASALPHSGQTVLKTSSGLEFAVAGSAAPIRDEEGHLVGVVFVFRNVTERRQTERELLRLSKQESLGQLAARIAHDFNNLLTVILGNLSLAKMLLTPSDAALRRLVDTEKACLRAKDLTKQLLAFSRGGLPVKKAITLEPLVRESARLILQDTGIPYRLNWPVTLPPVNVDAEQIHQLLYELLTNATHATPPGGTIHLSGDILHLESNSPLPLPAGEYVRLSIRDEGPGIPEVHLPRIFEPFFTTRENARGLGLPTCFLIARNHDGFLTVDSSPGIGSTFHLLVPALPMSAATAQLTSPMLLDDQALLPAALSRETPQPSVPGTRGAAPHEPEPGTAAGGPRILVMDDEAPICELAAELLGREGYDVQVSADGEEAIRKYTAAIKAGQPYEVVILDLTVRGGMGGKETMSRLLLLDPGVKAIVSSGYSQDPLVSRYRDFGFCGVVSKPYSITEMVQEIEQARTTKPASPGGSGTRV